LPELRLTRRAKDDLHALPEAVREAVLETLKPLEHESEDVGKRLLGRLQGFRSARVGSYRVLYTIESGGVVVRAIRHRAVAYRQRRKGQPDPHG
jgi:mRNA-degrading endonuclease RelE of RelBE toxin-antitoxin system